MERRDEIAWELFASGSTGVDGHVADWYPVAPKRPDRGVYRLLFDSGRYFAALGIAPFHPEVTIQFVVADPDADQHVPLLLGPYAYATFRGTD